MNAIGGINISAAKYIKVEDALPYIKDFQKYLEAQARISKETGVYINKGVGVITYLGKSENIKVA